VAGAGGAVDGARSDIAAMIYFDKLPENNLAVQNCSIGSPPIWTGRSCRFRTYQASDALLRENPPRPRQ
jgi:hypothetical protein